MQLRSFTSHPFIYQRMLRGADRAAKPGEVVNVYDKGGEYFGRGLYNPRSEIAVRMLTHADVPIDDAFWRAALGRAAELRYLLRIDDVTDAYRLVHAEGDDLSGLIVERYADCLVFEVFALGMYQRAARLAELLGEILPAPASLDHPQHTADRWHVIVRADERIESIEGFKTAPPAEGVPTSTVIRE
ncbi:MAG: hypothetical protein JXO22_06820, partial [Phycisphaerae bacterium]|nr:hypothetical protein [Phycisphaerae bacterium]